jgi:hypothetical protein
VAPLWQTAWTLKPQLVKSAGGSVDRALHAMLQ